MRISFKVLFALGTVIGFVTASNYYVSIKSNGPIVQGSTIQFRSCLHTFDGSVPSGSFKYQWIDNAIPSHSKIIETNNIEDTWNVTYDLNYPPGPYEVQIIVYRYYLILYEEITSLRFYFNITDTLNGGLSLTQRNQSLQNFVANNSAVQHTVVLNQPDAEFIQRNATSVIYYWFIDCVYHGPSTENNFFFNYTLPENDHLIEVLIVASFEPPTTVAPSTTTVPPKSTTVAPNTTTTTVKPKPTSALTTTTIKPQNHTANNATSTVLSKVKREVHSLISKPTKSIMVEVNGTLVPYNGSFPFVCLNSTIALDPKKTYGYFSRKMTVKAPVTRISVTGNNWLQHGDLLTLSVKCDGSKIFKYCVIYKTGPYNVTQNETCENHNTFTTDTCEIDIQRYYGESKVYTIIVVITNDVSKLVQPITVTVYKVQKQAQLSIIVVPVVSSLVAIVLIIFGVAYYFQNRSRFIVEVADFNFGQNYSDMEYKTFRERLRDSIANAFTRAPSPSSSDVPVWPPGRKYGSMT